jgi:membrane protease YdiL (CAAX protease family)
MKIVKNNRAVFGMVVFILLLAMQILLGKAGHIIASFIPYQQIDPFDSFVEISIHHAFELLTALSIILLLSKLLNLNFYFQLGNKKTGIESLTIFTVAFLVISIVQHTFMVMTNQLPVYAFPLDERNIFGTLGFQLLLSGSAEEVVFRAIPIILLTYSFGKSIEIKGDLTLEVILASILFAFAHVDWSLMSARFEVDFFQIIYAFVLGTIQGIVYQRSRSILYPVLMHSFSNVIMVGGGYAFTALFPL